MWLSSTVSKVSMCRTLPHDACVGHAGTTSVDNIHRQHGQPKSSGSADRVHKSAKDDKHTGDPTNHSEQSNDTDSSKTPTTSHVVPATRQRASVIGVSLAEAMEASAAVEVADRIQQQSQTQQETQANRHTHTRHHMMIINSTITCGVRK